MSGNGSGYSEFKTDGDHVLPTPVVKGTEGGMDQTSMKSNQVGGKSGKSKGGNTKKNGCAMGGKKAKKTNKRRSHKKNSFFFFW
jgi:hypothetical protein